MRVKVLSWNIWVQSNLPLIKEFLSHIDADIVCLQEVEGHKPDRDIFAFMRLQGYQYAFSPTIKMVGGMPEQRDGCAIFSRYPIVSSRVHHLSQVDTRVAVQASIDIGGRLTDVFCTHLVHVHQELSAAQTAQATLLAGVLTRERTILAGDFNAKPDSVVISLMRLLFKDTDPSNTPTWSRDPKGCLVCAPEGVAMRLDYIFTSPDLSVKSHEVPDVPGSDHLPTVVVLEV